MIKILRASGIPVLLLYLFAASGCATIFSSNSYTVNITTQPPDAEVTVFNTKKKQVIHQSRTPTIVSLSTKHFYFSKPHYKITAGKEGYHSQSVVIKPKLDPWYFGNLFFGGITGFLIVDPITGAMWKIKEKNIHIALQRDTTQVIAEQETFTFTLPETKEEPRVPTPVPKLVIKYSPVAIFELPAAVKLGLEHNIKGNANAEYEAGLVLPMRANNELENMRGFKLKSGIRAYNLFNSDLYAGFDVFYNRILYDRIKTFGRECENGDCNYWQEISYKVTRNVPGYHLKVGLQKEMFPKIVFDAFFGLGLKFIVVNSEPLPDDAVETWRNRSSNFFIQNLDAGERNSGRAYPSVTGGLRLGYVLK